MADRCSGISVEQSWLRKNNSASADNIMSYWILDPWLEARTAAKIRPGILRSIAVLLKACEYVEVRYL